MIVESDKFKAPKFARILVPTDFSRNAQEALQFAVLLASQLGAKITLLHVIEWQIDSKILGALEFISELNKDAEERAAGRLEKLARATVAADLLEETVLRFGQPHLHILEVANDLNIDLILISSKGRTGLRGVLLGCTAARIVRHALCPVLTVHPRTEPNSLRAKTPGPGPIINRILVPVVFSDECASSLRFATTLARMMHAQLVLLHVVLPLPRNYTRHLAEVQECDAQLRADAEQHLKELAATVPEDVKTRVLVRQATPYRGIIDAARQNRCDLIVLPTRGLKGLEHYMLGSTAEKVVRHAPCPVLTFNRYLTARRIRRSWIPKPV
ncbi:MAG: universal stress protein [Verrucomicrobia bacterium]|nr:universal stress protein [Verrucomicrobiota bacterium]